MEPSTRVPNNWHEFLRIDENKVELFEFLANEAMKIRIKTVITTNGINVRTLYTFVSTKKQTLEFLCTSKILFRKA